MAAHHCRTRQHNTHITGSAKVHYPWHPWCGRLVSISESLVKNGQTLCRCRLEADLRSRPLEVPLWMLDRAACCGMHLIDEPRVACGDLLRLKELLRNAVGDGGGVVLENQHRSLIGKGDADEKMPALPSDRSTGIVPPASKNTDLAKTAPRGQAKNDETPGADAAGTSCRGSGLKGTGGAR